VDAHTGPRRAAPAVPRPRQDQAHAITRDGYGIRLVPRDPTVSLDTVLTSIRRHVASAPGLPSAVPTEWPPTPLLAGISTARAHSDGFPRCPAGPDQADIAGESADESGAHRLPIDQFLPEGERKTRLLNGVR
jgi:hypothetical protein